MKKQLKYSLCALPLLGAASLAGVVPTYATTADETEDLTIIKDFFWGEGATFRNSRYSLSLLTNTTRTQDGGFATVGFDYEYGTGKDDGSAYRIDTELIKYDGDGNEEWSTSWVDCSEPGDSDCARGLLYSVAQGTDGNYMALAYPASSGKYPGLGNVSSESNEQALVKFNSEGKVVSGSWTISDASAAINYDLYKMYKDEFEGTTRDDYRFRRAFLTRIVALSDGGYAATGTGIARITYCSAYDEDDECENWADQTVMGGLIIYYDSDGEYEDMDFYADVKTAADGETSNENYTEEPETMTVFVGGTETADGGFVAAGAQLDASILDRNFDIENPLKAIIVKYDSKGNVVWENETSGANRRLALFTNVVELADGGFAAVGAADKLLPIRTYVAKYDANGKLVWDRTWLDEDTEAISSLGLDITTLENGHIIAVGTSARDIDVLKIIDTIKDDDGNNTMEDLVDSVALDATVLELDNDGNIVAKKLWDGFNLSTAWLSENKFVVVGADLDADDDTLLLNAHVSILGSNLEGDIKVPDTGLFTSNGDFSKALTVIAYVGGAVVALGLGAYVVKRVRAHRKVSRF